MKPYSVIVQAGPDEILHARKPSDLVFAQLGECPSIGEVLVAFPTWSALLMRRNPEYLG
jgi:hypothetical protein